MGTGSDGDVIDLHSRTGYNPDVAGVARSHVANARRRLGLTTEEFAEVLKPLLPNHRLTSGLIANWETTAVPPGDVLVAVGIVARAAPITADSGADDDVMHQLLGSRFADVSAVFTTRAELNSQLPPHELFRDAGTIDAAGLSLNMLCQQYPDDQLRGLIEAGTALRCLFLAPGGEAIARREHEEDYPLGHLSALTDMNIQILSERVRKRLGEDAQPRLQIATYEETIRFNVVIVDQQVAVVQPYLPSQRGVESPTFLIRRHSNSSGLYPLFEQMFTWLWERSTSL